VSKRQSLHISQGDSYSGYGRARGSGSNGAENSGTASGLLDAAGLTGGRRALYGSGSRPAAARRVVRSSRARSRGGGRRGLGPPPLWAPRPGRGPDVGLSGVGAPPGRVSPSHRLPASSPPRLPASPDPGPRRGGRPLDGPRRRRLRCAACLAGGPPRCSASAAQGAGPDTSSAMRGLRSGRAGRGPSGAGHRTTGPEAVRQGVAPGSNGRSWSGTSTVACPTPAAQHDETRDSLSDPGAGGDSRSRPCDSLRLLDAAPTVPHQECGTVPPAGPGGARRARLG
jgi:hypothetical protein